MICQQIIVTLLKYSFHMSGNPLLWTSPGRLFPGFDRARLGREEGKNEENFA
jgi:hypothetical protein